MAVKNIILIDSKSSKPKYRQIIDSIIQGIENKRLEKGDKIPSINEICKEFKLSRDTVMVAFNELKAKGIILSQPGKGYYIATTEIKLDEKIFILFDELNAFKEDLYNSLIESLKGRASVDIFFHHFNYQVFKKQILESIGNYTSYIIMPATFDNVSHLLSKIPPEKVYILDRLKPDLQKYTVVYQNFEDDFYQGLQDATSQLKKYQRLVFVHPGGKEPEERVRAFERYCAEKGFEHKVVRSLNNINPRIYDAFFVISDRDLVSVVKIVREYSYRLGENFGIVSFNDTTLKEVVAGGITTISTDFKAMGQTLAEMVLNKKAGQVRNPSRIIFRNSL